MEPMDPPKMHVRPSRLVPRCPIPALVLELRQYSERESNIIGSHVSESTEVSITVRPDLIPIRLDLMIEIASQHYCTCTCTCNSSGAYSAGQQIH